MNGTGSGIRSGQEWPGKRQESAKKTPGGRAESDMTRPASQGGLRLVLGLLLLLLLHRLALERFTHLLAVELGQVSLELVVVLGVRELQPLLSTDEQDFLFRRISGRAGEFYAFGGGLAAHVSVDFGHAQTIPPDMSSGDRNWQIRNSVLARVGRRR